MPTILILRRNANELSPAEERLLKEAYPGQELKFVRSDPKTYQDHLEDCKRILPDVVILPMERPIPSVAMEQGFRHITVKPDGSALIELKPLKPEFIPFVPS